MVVVVRCGEVGTPAPSALGEAGERFLATECNSQEQVRHPGIPQSADSLANQQRFLDIKIASEGLA